MRPAVVPKAYGDYELLERVAVGGMGEVFLARKRSATGIERFVALKRMLADLSRDEHAVLMFLDEARLASRLDHQNVGRIYDLGVADDRYFLAMEFLEGRDMRRVMGRLGKHRWPLPFAFTAAIVGEAARGLHYAHELGDDAGVPLNVIHRDVSPQNLFVTAFGTIKVVDFGIAKARSRLARTLDGVMRGKSAYLAPEQVLGRPVDRRVDVFALGIVLWELSIGKRLFRRETDMSTLMAIASSEVPRPRAMCADYPLQLEAVVLKALARDPDDRYQTCRELRDDLAEFMNSAGYVVTPQRLGEWIRTVFEGQPLTIPEILASSRSKAR